jgi:hypothetical protein
MKISLKAQEKYAWYLSCARKDEPRPLPSQRVVFTETGVSALEAFHFFESSGLEPLTKEPLLLERYKAGKVWHGVTVAMVAEDYVGRLVCSAEIKANYPPWVAGEIFAAAAKLAKKQIGFVPKFVSEQKDFSELPCPTR